MYFPTVHTGSQFCWCRMFCWWCLFYIYFVPCCSVSPLHSLIGSILIVVRQEIVNYLCSTKNTQTITLSHTHTLVAVLRHTPREKQDLAVSHTPSISRRNSTPHPGLHCGDVLIAVWVKGIFLGCPLGGNWVHAVWTKWDGQLKCNKQHYVMLYLLGTMVWRK